jgi:hypothetical protein
MPLSLSCLGGKRSLLLFRIDWGGGRCRCTTERVMNPFQHHVASDISKGRAYSFSAGTRTCVGCGACGIAFGTGCHPIVIGRTRRYAAFLLVGETGSRVTRSAVARPIFTGEFVLLYSASGEL